MSTLQFAAAALVSYFGLLAGFFLASLTKEELPTAVKYFPWLQKLVILAAAAMAINFFGLGIVVKIVSYSFVLLLFTLNISTMHIYAILGVLLFAVSSSSNALMAISSLVFIFGLFVGSDCFAKTAKKKDMTTAAKNLLVKNSAYVAVALAARLLFNLG